MGPPRIAARAAWERNFKAREYTADEWQQHFETFKQLYFIEDRGLPEVREIMATDHKFYATEVQYKKRITKWELEKNIKKDDMLLMLKKRKKREAEEGKETEFFFKGRPVIEEKFERFQKRHKGLVLAPSPENICSPVATPSYISYQTPRYNDPDTPVPCTPQRGGDTPQPMDCSSPKAAISGSVSEESALHNAVNTPPSNGPVISNPTSPTSFLDQSRNYRQLGDQRPFYPPGEISNDFSIDGHLQLPLSMTAGTEYSAILQPHPLHSDSWVADTPGGTMVGPVINTLEDSLVWRPKNRDEEANAVEGTPVLLHSLGKRFEDVSGSEHNEVARFVSRVVYDPLAIKLAAAYISISGISVADYLLLYNGSMSKIINRISQGTTTSGSYYTLAAFEVSFAAVERECREAADILLTCAYLHHDNIFDNLIRYSGGARQKDFVVKGAVDKMLSYSLVEQIPSGDGFSINPSIHSWLRERLDPNMSQKKMKDALQLIRKSVLCEGYSKTDDWVFGARVLPHVHVFRQNVESYIQPEYPLAKEYSDTLIVIGNLALTYQNQGRWNEAEKLEVQVMEARQKVLGEEHPHTLTTIGNLALTYWNQGRWKEAEKLQVQVMEASQKVLGEEHPHTLIAIGNLALTYRKQGWWEEAEKLQVQVMEARQKVLGEEHPDTLIAIGSLASTYRKQGRWEEAEKLQVQVMEARQKVLGEEHPDTLIAIGSLALTYRSQGRWKEAEKLQVQVMEASQKVLGGEHPDTPIAIGNLALTYHNQGRWNEAEKLQVQVMEASQKVLGEEHPDTLIAIGNLALTYRKQGRWKEVERLQVQVMEASQKVLGEEHPHTLTTIGNLASTYWNQGRWKEAEKLQVQVMETSQKVLGEEHPDTLIAIGNLALTYRSQGRWKEVERLQVQVMEARQKVLGEEHPHTLIAIGNLASTYRSQGRWSEVEGLEVHMVAIRKKVQRDSISHPPTMPVAF